MKINKNKYFKDYNTKKSVIKISILLFISISIFSIGILLYSNKTSLNKKLKSDYNINNLIFNEVSNSFDNTKKNHYFLIKKKVINNDEIIIHLRKIESKRQIETNIQNLEDKLITEF